MRKRDREAAPTDTAKPVCKYEPYCYRSSEEHLARFSHPSRDAPASPARPIVTRTRSASPVRGASPGRSFQSASPAASSSTAVPGPPEPRVSPLSGLPDAVYEMPHPTEDLNIVLTLARKLKPDHPLTAFHPIVLVGPFMLLLAREGDVSGSPSAVFGSDVAKWTHFRFRLDPPELQTIAVKVGEGGAPTAHYCFHRDDPAALPTMVVSGCGHSDSPKFAIESPSFAQLLSLLQPQHAEALGCQRHYDRAAFQKRRSKLCVAATYSSLGVCVPYNKKTELGYREMHMEADDLYKALTDINTARCTKAQKAQFDDQLRMNDISNDECDFGLGLQLGLEMFSFAGTKRRNEVTHQCVRVLDMAYMLLGRDLFRHILACHAAENWFTPSLERTRRELEAIIAI